jgi:hypothetical protein
VISPHSSHEGIPHPALTSIPYAHPISQLASQGLKVKLVSNGSSPSEKFPKGFLLIREIMNITTKAPARAPFQENPPSHT